MSELSHYGTVGMKWGKPKAATTSGDQVRDARPQPVATKPASGPLTVSDVSARKISFNMHLPIFKKPTAESTKRIETGKNFLGDFLSKAPQTSNSAATGAVMKKVNPK